MTVRAAALAPATLCLALFGQAAAQPYAAGAVRVSAQLPPPPLSADEAAALVAQLGHADFARRESAMRRLSDGGAQAAEPIAAAIKRGDQEVRWRGIAVLMHLSKQTASAETACQALLRLDILSPTQRLAVASRLVQHRRIHIARQIERLGGQFPRFYDDRTSRGTEVLLTDRWTGGVEGLAPLVKLGDVAEISFQRAPLRLADCQVLHEMPRLRNLKVEYMPLSADDLELIGQLSSLDVVQFYGTGVSPEQMQVLKQQLPRTAISLHGGGYLGVTMNTADEGCEIRALLENGGAERAGLLPGDRVTHIDEQPTPDFDTLRETVARHAPGQTLAIKYLRDGQPYETEVKLTERP